MYDYLICSQPSTPIFHLQTYNSLHTIFNITCSFREKFPKFSDNLSWSLYELTLVVAGISEKAPRISLGVALAHALMVHGGKWGDGNFVCASTIIKLTVRNAFLTSQPNFISIHTYRK